MYTRTARTTAMMAPVCSWVCCSLPGHSLFGQTFRLMQESARGDARGIDQRTPEQRFMSCKPMAFIMTVSESR